MRESVDHLPEGDTAASLPARQRSGEPPVARTVQSVERAFQILEKIAASEESLGLAELSRATGLHTSTTFHLIKTLIVLGYVRQDDDRRYRIGAQLFVQAAAATSEIALVNCAMPFLKRLAETAGETTHLAVRADSGIAVIAKADAVSSVRTSERVGIVRPAHATGIGKVLLSALPQDELEAYLRSGPFHAFTDNTITDPVALRAELDRVAAMQIAYDDAEFNREVRCIAAPVRNYTLQTIAAIGLSGPAWRVGDDDLPRLAVLVTEAAAGLSRDLGYKSAACRPSR